MKVVNLTPHDVIIVNDDDTIKMVIKPAGLLARVKATVVATGDSVCGIPITKTEFGEVEGLPEPKEGTTYVVSRMVAEAAKERGDLFIPNESVRDESGRIIGCRSLTQV